MSRRARLRPRSGNSARLHAGLIVALCALLLGLLAVLAPLSAQVSWFHADRFPHRALRTV